MRPFALLLLSLAGLGGCTGLAQRDFATWQVDPAATGEIDFHGLPVRNGQLVASEQGSSQSLFLALMLTENYRWVHTGVVAIENGQPVVYEAMGRIRPTFRDRPPTASVGGGVRRVTLASYIERQRFVALFDPPPGTDAKAMVTFAHDAWLAGTPFDAYFDMGDASRMYCSELSARALEAGGAPPRRTLPLNDNPSIRIIVDWLRVRPDVGVVPAEAIVADGRRVALLSREHTPGQIEAYFAVKAELHRRFTADQRLGNIFAFSSLGGLKFRQDIVDFRRAVNEAALGWTGESPERIEADVRALAGERLGPFDAVRYSRAPDGGQRSGERQSREIAGEPAPGS